MVGSGLFRRRSRRELDAVADGASDGSPLGDFVAEMRSLGDGDGVEPGRSLTEFVSGPRREPDTVVAGAAAESKASTPMIAQLSALAATTVGKVVLTGGIAAAAFGGAVVVNEAQEPSAVEVVAAGDSRDSSSSPSPSTSTSTTAPESTSTTPTVSDSSTSTSTSSSSTTAPGSVAVADTDPITIDANGAGTVTYQVSGGQLVLIDASPSAGWTLRNESTAVEIDLSFRTADSVQRVDVDIEIEDGQPRVRIERKSDDDLDSDDSNDHGSDESDERDESDDDDQDHTGESDEADEDQPDEDDEDSSDDSDDDSDEADD